jgi:hypothetical protein
MVGKSRQLFHLLGDLSRWHVSKELRVWMPKLLEDSFVDDRQRGYARSRLALSSRVDIGPMGVQAVRLLISDPGKLPPHLINVGCGDPQRAL